jgi:LmbE family N-acetylglucosaminyl deacetylase
VGTASLVQFGIPDGSVAKAGVELRARLHATLRPLDVVFATWQFDGHPDHETVGRITFEVCAALGITHYQVPVWMWHWAVPEDERIPWDRLRIVNLTDAIVQRKKAAVAAHHSQLAPDPSTGRAAIIPPTMLARMERPWEVVIR